MYLSPNYISFFLNSFQYLKFAFLKKVKKIAKLM